ncbi:MAG TPA: hypothetical protein VEC99_09385, partial [Clostridia bacterium]|nr:hypothetical protein [Clostridia bacterium]
PGKTYYPAPRFYVEMVELMGELLRHKYDVWVVSASNIWSVRWMILHALNPLLKARGIKQGLRPDHVVGISTLLTDRAGRLYKDAVLVRDNPEYATLDTATLGKFFVTRHPQFPVPTYSGKVACILDAIGVNPYLCVGDSPSDHPMMSFSRNRLWIARLYKPDFQRKTVVLTRQTGSQGWIIQPTLGAPANSFLPALESSSEGIKRAVPEMCQSIQILRTLMRKS